MSFRRKRVAWGIFAAVAVAVVLAFVLGPPAARKYVDPDRPGYGPGWAPHGARQVAGSPAVYRTVFDAAGPVAGSDWGYWQDAVPAPTAVGGGVALVGIRRYSQVVVVRPVARLPASVQLLELINQGLARPVSQGQALAAGIDVPVADRHPDPKGSFHNYLTPERVIERQRTGVPLGPFGPVRAARAIVDVAVTSTRHPCADSAFCFSTYVAVRLTLTDAAGRTFAVIATPWFTTGWGRPHIAAVGDWTGDGLPDAVWEDSQGRAHLISFERGQVVQRNLPVAAGSFVIGAGDIERDNRAEIISTVRGPELEILSPAAGSPTTATEHRPAIEPAGQHHPCELNRARLTVWCKPR